MSTTNTNNPDRIDQLMVDAATQGLSPQDEAELQAALAQDARLRAEAQAYELSATAIELALTIPGGGEALPDALRQKLIASANASFGKQSDAPALKLTDAPQPTPAQEKFSWTDGRAFGWYAAVAALLALAVLVFNPRDPGGAGTDPAPTLAQQYDALATEAGTVAASWGFAGNGADERFAKTTGEVIWNTDTQTGYMKLNGLPVNDPTKEQYQLWIVDASRDTAVEFTNRIDGGVFDITAQGEVIIPIDAKLVARQAAAFAITVETPGGVVESKGPLQVLAAVEAG